MTEQLLNRRRLLINTGFAAAGGAVLGTGAVSTLPVAVAYGQPRATSPISVAYVEVNNHHLRQVADYALATTGAPVFDLGIIFAANINYDGERAYLFCNPQVQATLDNATTEIKPLQDKGIKVLLSVLGNHQGAGFANFPDRASAAAFADQLAAIVEQYGLDGIDFDDEYAEYGVGGTGQPNDFSFVYLVSALRERLPDKIITLYYIGPSSTRLSFDGVNVGDLIDYSWNPYYGSWLVPDVPGLSPAELGPAAVAIADTDTTTAAALARRTLNEGYGVYLTYNLPDTDVHDYLSTFTQPLYGSDANYLG
ncbi:endo-beta-N-acetylglucosaminidase H [Microlunatus soli]|uniref:Glycosyl hydrolases family 18 n=1 Tax=Microlunatus soli TaxID=630515 RepID=A0A1H1Q1P2_9ACTN|nr:endo-beta-N-acetylglucosaminidase H [Microlunatus soli]SDS17314.1 Glycosyl hydrolases family 18 [Microlunatus soli]